MRDHCCAECDEDERFETDQDSCLATLDALYRLVCETVGHADPVPQTYRLRALKPVGREWHWTVCPTCRDVLGGDPPPALTVMDDQTQSIYTPEVFAAALGAPSPFWAALQA